MDFNFIIDGFHESTSFVPSPSETKDVFVELLNGEGIDVDLDKIIKRSPFAYSYEKYEFFAN